MEARLTKWRAAPARGLSLDRLPLQADELAAALQQEAGGVEVLGLFRCGLGPRLPTAIFALSELKSLTELHLGGNALEALPQSIGELALLTILSAQGNHLASLPDSLGELSALTSLDLANNRLSSLPASLGQCSALRLLELSGNLQLAALPVSLGQLGPGLQHLGLARTEALVTPPCAVADQGATACVAWLRERAAAAPEPEPESEPEPEPAALRAAMLNRGHVQLHKALSAAVVEALCAELTAELSNPSVPPESGTPQVDLVDESSWPSGGSRRVIEAVPTRGADGAGCGSSPHWRAVVECPALAHALDALLGAGCWDLPLNDEYEGGTIGTDYVRHWYAPVMFPEEFAGEESKWLGKGGDGGDGALDLGDEGSWRTNEGEDWTAEQDATLMAARFPNGSDGKQQPVGWKAVAKVVEGGRTAKQCRERRGGLQPWTTEEDQRLLSLYDERGPAWSAIVQQSGMQDRSKRHVRVRAATLLKERAASVAAAAAAVRIDPADEAELQEAVRRRAANEWEAVNRRRVRGKGWHVDIGPGFSTDWMRTAEGHPYQGCVVLVLLTDCAPGQGGTCFATGSHRRVGEYLRAVRAPQSPELAADAPAGSDETHSGGEDALTGGVVHQQLNSWCIEHVTGAMAAGALPYHRVTDTDAPTKPDTAAAEQDVSGWGRIEQIAGKAGDIVLVHPWSVHSGTTNLGGLPRLMLNGMVRITQESFAGRGHPLLRGTLATLG